MGHPPGQEFEMWIAMNPRFRDEAERYRLVFTCEQCGNWSPEEEACTILYPTEPHRRSTVDKLQDGERLYFCKMFESV
jgi:hypothetical protein